MSTTTTTTTCGVVVTETEDRIIFRVPSWLTVEERARIRSSLREWWAANALDSSGKCAVISADVHGGWCNAHVDDEDGPGFCSRESEPAPSFGVNVTEDDDGLAIDLWHPMRPGQERRSFTAGEARAIAAELVRAAELVEAEGGEPKA